MKLASISFALFCLGLTSCKKTWNAAEEQAYMESCIGNANGTPDAEKICKCTLEKIKVKYPNPDDASNMSDQEVNALIADCK